MSASGPSVSVLDLFAGPGGWDEGARQLGIVTVGVEWDEAACLTAKAAGHARVRADVAKLPTEPMFGKVRGVIASPPCTTFSPAGKGKGRDLLPELCAAVGLVWRGQEPADVLPGEDPTSKLVLEPVRFARDLAPEWIALEQVPEVLPIWRALAFLLPGVGYSVWTGVLNSADYGVPQTRERAILIASRSRTVHPPAPTHARDGGHDDLFGAHRSPWVSMAEALDWPRGLTVNTRGDRRTSGGNEFSADRSSWALTGTARSWVVDRRTNSKAARGTMEPTVPVGIDRPAPTFTGKSGTQWVIRPDVGAESFRVTLAEASILQSFPPDYPWRGSRTKQFEQVGNAVPPLLAAHVLGAVTGLALSRPEEAVA